MIHIYIYIYIYIYILSLISVFLLQCSYVFIAYFNKLQGIRGFPYQIIKFLRFPPPKYKVFEVSPTLRGSPLRFFPVSPPLEEETGGIYLANTGSRGFRKEIKLSIARKQNFQLISIKLQVNFI